MIYTWHSVTRIDILIICLSNNITFFTSFLICFIFLFLVFILLTLFDFDRKGRYVCLYTFRQEMGNNALSSFWFCLCNLLSSHRMFLLCASFYPHDTYMI